VTPKPADDRGDGERHTSSSEPAAGEPSDPDVVGTFHRELEAAYKKLEASNEALATANAELRATLAELEQTNRELELTNQELEDLTRELQDTNEEVATLSAELRRRSDEVDEVNAYLTSVLDALDLAVVVVDPDLRVRTWNRRAQERWSRTRQEVMRRSLFGLDIGFPLDALAEPLRAALEGRDHEPHFELDSVDGRSEPEPTLVSLRALRTSGDEIAGAVLVVAPASADFRPTVGRSRS
jgi:two-component system CheB/CheR fusion protein